MCRINLDELYLDFRNDKMIYHSIKTAFCKLYTNDSYLICNNPIVRNVPEELGEHHVGERSIVFRFAHYLQCELSSSVEYSSYYVDCEYNRHIADIKDVGDNSKAIYPDLVVHKRGSDANNLLVIEFKAYWNDKTNELEKDINKVEFMKKPPYNYKYGLVVIIGKTMDKLGIIPVKSL